MKYQIENTISAVIIGVFEASTADEALELMAQENGYKSYQEACSVSSSDGIKVTEVQA